MNSIQRNVDKRQFGNQKGISTTHCLVDIYHNLVSGACIPNNVSTLALTDFTKAFDMVNHEIAIDKLLELGVSPAIVQWIASFVTSRQQRVRYKQTFSDWHTLFGGVPQGTKLGPVVFLAYINNAVDSTQNKCWKYVDDLTINENRHINGVSRIQADLNNLNDWALANKIHLNPSKCSTMQVYFGGKKSSVCSIFHFECSSTTGSLC